MIEKQIVYMGIYLLGTFLSSISQVLLKKAAMKSHKNIIAEYTDIRVIIGYSIFLGCTLLTLLAYKEIPMSIGPILESTGYVYITIFGAVFFREKITKKKIKALLIILIGIIIYVI